MLEDWLCFGFAWNANPSFKSVIKYLCVCLCFVQEVDPLCAAILELCVCCSCLKHFGMHLGWLGIDEKHLGMD